jgi:hypothetical protein
MREGTEQSRRADSGGTARVCDNVDIFRLFVEVVCGRIRLCTAGTASMTIAAPGRLLAALEDDASSVTKKCNFRLSVGHCFFLLS